MGEYRGPSRAVPFARYAEACCERKAEEYAYRLYVAESLRLQGEGKYIPTSLDELLHPRAIDIDVDSVIDRVASALEEE